MYPNERPPYMLDGPDHQTMSHQSPPRLSRRSFITPLPRVGLPADVDIHIHELLSLPQSGPSPIIFDITTLASFARLNPWLAQDHPETWRCDPATSPPSEEVVIMPGSIDIPPIFARPLRGRFVTVWDVLSAVYCAYRAQRYNPFTEWGGLTPDTARGVWNLHLRLPST